MLTIVLAAPALAADTGLANFRNVNEYTTAKFTDVDSKSWYFENIKIAYELGLMQ